MRKGFATIAYAIVGTLAALFRSAHVLHQLDPAPATPSDATPIETAALPSAATMPIDATDLGLEPAAYRLVEQGTAPASEPPSAHALVAQMLKPLQLAGNTKQTAAQKKSDSQIDQALTNLHLTAAQRLAARAYIGHQHDLAKNKNTNGVQDLVFHHPKTHAYRGEALLSLLPDGGLQIAKISGAQFDHAKQVQVLILKREMQEAQEVLHHKRSADGFRKAWAPAQKTSRHPKEDTIGLSVPTVRWLPNAPYHRVSRSAALIGRDGSGTESGWATNFGGAKGARLPHGGAPAAGAPTVKINYFKNYFLPPRPDRHGKFTRTVLGGTIVTNTTVNQFIDNTSVTYGDTRFGDTTITNENWNYESKENTPVEIDDTIGDEGIITPPGEETTDETLDDATPVDVDQSEFGDTSGQDDFGDVDEPTDQGTGGVEEATSDDMDVPDQEEQAYEDAMQDGSTDSLNRFLNDYAGSPYEDDVKDRLTEDENVGTGGATPNGDENTIY
jgi:hypothetical protein